MRIHVKHPDRPPQELRLEEVNRMLAKGELDGDELAWTPGLADWTQLRLVHGAVMPTPPQLPDAVHEPIDIAGKGGAESLEQPALPSETVVETSPQKGHAVRPLQNGHASYALHWVCPLALLLFGLWVGWAMSRAFPEALPNGSPVVVSRCARVVWLIGLFWLLINVGSLVGGRAGAGRRLFLKMPGAVLVGMPLCILGVIAASYAGSTPRGALAIPSIAGIILFGWLLRPKDE